MAERVNDQCRHGHAPDQLLRLAQDPGEDQQDGQRQQRRDDECPPDRQRQVRLVDIAVLDVGQFVQEDGVESGGLPDRRDRRSTADGDEPAAGPAESERRQASIKRLKQPDHRAGPGPPAHPLQAAHQVRGAGPGQLGQAPPSPVPPGLRQEDDAGHDEQHADAQQAPQALGTLPSRVTHRGLLERVVGCDHPARVLRQRLIAAPEHQRDQRRPARCGQVDALVDEEARCRHRCYEQCETEARANRERKGAAAVPGAGSRSRRAAGRDVGQFHAHKDHQRFRPVPGNSRGNRRVKPHRNAAKSSLPYRARRAVP